MLTIHTILHPTDFSEESLAAFHFASALARDYKARLVLLTVYSPPLTEAEAVDHDRAEGIKEDLRCKLRALKTDPILSIEYRIEEGRPADVILALAEEIRADLIVMGTYGQSSVRRLVMGSVTEEVNRGAKCPVVTVRGEFRPTPDPVIEPTTSKVEDVANDEVGPEDWCDLPRPDNQSCEVAIPVGSITLQGTLRWVDEPRGMVVFAHGSGSSRHSHRNQYVASELNDAGFTTLLLDLLTAEEDIDTENVFDIELLADRVAGAVEWFSHEPETAGLPVGLFGASTGSAAALMAAAHHSNRVAAVVSRGGRPDLAWDALPLIKAPTLLIVGGDDEPVLSWNRDALKQLTCSKELTVISGASHLFKETGALEVVAQLARDWFNRHLIAKKKLTEGMSAV
jgi:putative phosphoribosyl transferase